MYVRSVGVCTCMNRSHMICLKKRVEDDACVTLTHLRVEAHENLDRLFRTAHTSLSMEAVAETKLPAHLYARAPHDASVSVLLSACLHLCTQGMRDACMCSCFMFLRDNLSLIDCV